MWQEDTIVLTLIIVMSMISPTFYGTTYTILAAMPSLLSGLVLYYLILSGIQTYEPCTVDDVKS